jgi:hypothetical protein
MIGKKSIPAGSQSEIAAPYGETNYYIYLVTSIARFFHLNADT